MSALMSARRDAFDNPSSEHRFWRCKGLQDQ